MSNFVGVKPKFDKTAKLWGN